MDNLILNNLDFGITRHRINIIADLLLLDILICTYVTSPLLNWSELFFFADIKNV